MRYEQSQYLFYKILMEKIPYIILIACRFQHYRYRPIWKKSYRYFIGILLVFYRYQPIRKFECIGLYLYWLIWKKAYRLYTEICKNCIHKFKQWINYFENNRQNLSTHVEVVISKNNRNRQFWEITGIWDDRLLFSITGIDDQGLNDKMDLKVFSIMSKYFF